MQIKNWHEHQSVVFYYSINTQGTSEVPKRGTEGLRGQELHPAGTAREQPERSPARAVPSSPVPPYGGGVFSINTHQITHFGVLLCSESFLPTWARYSQFLYCRKCRAWWRPPEKMGQLKCDVSHCLEHLLFSELAKKKVTLTVFAHPSDFLVQPRSRPIS